MALLGARESVRALEGFFHLRLSCDAVCAASTIAQSTPLPTAPSPPLSPPLFSSFDIVPNSWEELGRKIQDAEAAPLPDGATSRHVKIVYFVRHAEGYHNVAERELGTERWEAVEAKQPAFLDADLTPFGIEDTKSKGPPALEAEHARGMPPVERIIVSPLSRAIQTAQYFFAAPHAPTRTDQTSQPTSSTQQITRPFTVIESCRETLGVHSCDKRRTISELRAKFQDVIDLSRIKDEHDVLWKSDHRETAEELQQRAHEFLVELRDVPERSVAVVTHSGFISSIWSLFHREIFKPANCEVVPLVLEWVDQS